MKYLNSCVISCLLWRSCNLWSTDFNRQIFVFNKEIWRRKKEQKEQKEKGKCVHEMTHCTCDCAWTQAAGLEVSGTALLVSSLTLEKQKQKKIILKRDWCVHFCVCHHGGPLVAFSAPAVPSSPLGSIVMIIGTIVNFTLEVQSVDRPYFRRWRLHLFVRSNSTFFFTLSRSDCHSWPRPYLRIV